MLILQDIQYLLPDLSVLFKNINLSSYPKSKIAIVGNNGSGKSTLLKIIAGKLPVQSGYIHRTSMPYYIPQLQDEFRDMTIAQVLQVDPIISALHQILAGEVNDSNMTTLNDQWDIEERLQAAFQYWELGNISPNMPFGTLSGGEKTKVFLAGISIHTPEWILMDEPSNHLDADSRRLLYNFIQHSNKTFIIVSHDKQLLQLLDTTIELKQDGLHIYGGNYDFYLEQKSITTQALQQNIKSQELLLKKSIQKEKDAMERQQKSDARGKQKQEKAGMPTIVQNLMRNKAEQSTAKMRTVHMEKNAAQQSQLSALKKQIPDIDKMKFGFDESELHKGKKLFEGIQFNYSYGKGDLWPQDINLSILSGDRWAIKGKNGAGKTTLLKIIQNTLQATKGTTQHSDFNHIYLEQDYHSINDALTVIEQAEKYNLHHMEPHLVKSQLHKFLFQKEDWDKPCGGLSGGERMKLLLCCIAISQKAPDMIILDEPTNNLDIQNVEILSQVIRHYKGTILVISHDEEFLKAVDIQKTFIV